MKKRVLATILGVIVGVIIVSLGDYITHIITPLPKNMNTNDPKEFISFNKTIPFSTFVIMMFFWLLSSFVGGMVAAFLNKKDWIKASIYVGLLLMTATLMNLYLIPGHPTWMWILSIIGFIPLSYLGGKTIPKKENVDVRL